MSQYNQALKKLSEVTDRVLKSTRERNEALKKIHQAGEGIGDFIKDFEHYEKHGSPTLFHNARIRGPHPNECPECFRENGEHSNDCKACE